MNSRVKPHSMANSRALSTRAKPNRATPIRYPFYAGLILTAVNSPLNSTPTPRPTAPKAEKANPAAIYSYTSKVSISEANTHIYI